ncbi:MAG: NRDE family protein [Halioglobus sp.]
MCLMILAHQVSPEYPLLVAANRDEFNARPTAVSDFWDDQPNLLAGRDLEQGGTWMGVTRRGRFAAVTNYRDPARTAVAPCSRGELPLGFLTGCADPASYLGVLEARATDYAGFNLLVGDGNSLWYFSNSDNEKPLCLPPGIYGLSNARLDTPWPKVTAGKAKLRTLLAGAAITHDALSNLVNDKQLADPSTLRSHGLDGSMDPMLSAQFIVSKTYGTRSTTTLWLDADARVSWREQSFNAQGELRDVQQKDFRVVG